MTKADYDELVRLRDERGAEVLFRNPVTKVVKAYGFMVYGAADERMFEFLKDGQAIHVPSAIAEYEDAEREGRETYRDSTQVTWYCPICAERAKQEQQEPEPLTLDELLDMEGHPIWTSTIGIEMSGRYELCTGHTICVCPLHRVLRCVTADGEVTDYELGTYGKTWIAYATEPKGDAET